MNELGEKVPDSDRQSIEKKIEESTIEGALPVNVNIGCVLMSARRAREGVGLQ